MEGHSSADLLQITPADLLKTLISWIRCVWLGLEQNSAELWPSRNWVWDHCSKEKQFIFGIFNQNAIAFSDRETIFLSVDFTERDCYFSTPPLPSNHLAPSWYLMPACHYVYRNTVCLIALHGVNSIWRWFHSLYLTLFVTRCRNNYTWFYGQIFRQMYWV